MSEACSKNFSVKELRCKCPHCLGTRANGCEQWAVDKIQRMRDDLGFVMPLNSAYRCRRHPDEAKKKKAGRHNRGIGFDFRVPWGHKRELIVAAARKQGAKRFGYGKHFLHVDFDTTRATSWGYY